MARAMPEIHHGENALLGETGDELAEHTAAACRDETLRRKIVEGGRRTWEREFRPQVVVDRIVRRIESDLTGPYFPVRRAKREQSRTAGRRP
jgi:hypothetical protein